MPDTATNFPSDSRPLPFLSLPDVLSGAGVSVAADDEPLPNSLLRFAAADTAPFPVHRAATARSSAAGWRLRKHADYQRVYKASRKHFSSSMSYFFALRPPALAGDVVPPDGLSIRGARVGLTAGKVLGNAVVRNRIKRRMREAVRKHVAVMTADVDVILHPRNFVITMDFAKLEAEVGKIFATVQATLDGGGKKR